MAKITINEELCKGCALCTVSCPKKLIRISPDRMNGHGYFVAQFGDASQCIGCALCATMCPDCAIEVEK